jgi:hypothetical protein
VGKMRMNYGIQNSEMYEEMNRYFSKINQETGKFLMKYAKIQSQITSEQMMIWADIQAETMGMQEGKSIKEVYL